MNNGGPDQLVLDWLNNQLSEIDQWRSELLGGNNQASLSALDRLEQHKNWLESALSNLNPRDQFTS